MVSQRFSGYREVRNANDQGRHHWPNGAIIVTVVHLHASPTPFLAERQPAIWAVASGKGGVGKSFISSSLGLALARHGKRVVLIDLDLGGANLHTCLGVPTPSATLSDFISGKHTDINALITPTPTEGVEFISGAADSLHIANIRHFEKLKILRNLKQIRADIVLLDLGAGTSFNTLDFFAHAEHGILAVTPEPTSIENTYRFLRELFARQLRTAPTPTSKLMNDVLTGRQIDGRKITTLSAFLEAMEQLHPRHGALLRQELAAMHLYLIVNGATEPGDAELGQAMELACRKYFGIDISYLGYLNHDRQVAMALRQHKPFMSAFPQSRVAIHLDHIAAQLLESSSRPRTQA